MGSVLGVLFRTPRALWDAPAWSAPTVLSVLVSVPVSLLSSGLALAGVVVVAAAAVDVVCARDVCL